MRSICYSLNIQQLQTEARITIITAPLAYVTQQSSNYWRSIRLFNQLQTFAVYVQCAFARIILRQKARSTQIYLQRPLQISPKYRRSSGRACRRQALQYTALSCMQKCSTCCCLHACMHACVHQSRQGGRKEDQGEVEKVPLKPRKQLNTQAQLHKYNK